MLLSTLFSLSTDLCLVDVRLEGEGLTLVLRSSQTSAVCPACAQPSTSVHGHYTRRLTDLPCQKRPVRVLLEVSRFACRTRGCPRTTFAERFPRLARAYARRTLRQAEALTEIAFAQGGKAGAQLANRLVQLYASLPQEWSSSAFQREVPSLDARTQFTMFRRSIPEVKRFLKR